MERERVRAVSSKHAWMVVIHTSIHNFLDVAIRLPPLPACRLKDSRGGDLAVRPGLVSEAPMVRLDPVAVSVPEGGLAQFKIVASVRGGVRRSVYMLSSWPA